MMADWDGLSEDLATQAAQLWRHLPPDEVADDEPLAFRTDSEGRLIIAVPATGLSYGLRDSLGWKVRPVGGGSYEVTIWECGELCELYLMPLEEVSARWN